MGTIKFYLFGKFHIAVGPTLVQKIESQKAKELLVYLLLYRDQPQSRDRLAEILWREIASEQSKSYLRKALWQLQTLLESFESQNILSVDGEWLQINLGPEAWLDIELLQKTFVETQGIRGKDLDEAQVARIHVATGVYQGDLLDGWYQDWCLYERERLQFLYLALLDKLIDHCEAQEDYENGLMLGDRILHYDRARERTHRQLMRLHYLAGDRTSGLRQYQRCVAALKEELGVDPADHTRILYEMIRADKLEISDQPKHADKNNSPELEEPLYILFSHLSGLHKSLSRMQIQISQDMRVIQETIRNNHS